MHFMALKDANVATGTNICFWKHDNYIEQAGAEQCQAQGSARYFSFKILVNQAESQFVFIT